MGIHILKADANRCHNIVPVDEGDWRIFRSFDGSRRIDTWKSPRVRVLVDKDHCEDRRPSDFPSLATHIPVFSERAVTALRPLIEPFGEFLRLTVSDLELYAFNVTELAEVLDINKSSLQMFPDGQRIMRIRRHVFNDSAVLKLPIFKLVQLPLMYVYVNDAFADTVKRHDLTGFLFEVP